MSNLLSIVVLIGFHLSSASKSYLLQHANHYRKTLQSWPFYQRILLGENLSEKERLSKENSGVTIGVPNHAFYSYLKVLTYFAARRTPPADGYVVKSGLQ